LELAQGEVAYVAQVAKAHVPLSSSVVFYYAFDKKFYPPGRHPKPRGRLG
jgi:hypothetical protein